MLITNVTATARLYNGTTAATLTGAGVSNVVNSDVVNFTIGSGTFGSRNVGSQTVTASGFALAATGAATNYTLTAQPLVPSATITATNITITAQANTKVYDGLTNSATAAAITVGGIQTGDSAPNLDASVQYGNGGHEQNNYAAQ